MTKADRELWLSLAAQRRPCSQTKVAVRPAEEYAQAGASAQHLVALALLNERQPLLLCLCLLLHGAPVNKGCCPAGEAGQSNQAYEELEQREPSQAVDDNVASLLMHSPLVVRVDVGR